MRKLSIVIRPAILWMALSLSAPAAFADGAIPTISPDSTHVVSFTYSQQSVYHIRTEPHMVTDLKLAPGEVMEMLVLGNTAQWISASAPGNVFLKATSPGLTTSGTLVTNMRTYQLFITSSKSGNWYQQVSWMSGPMVAMQNPIPPAPMMRPQSADTTKPVKTHGTQSIGQESAVKAMSNLHFNYRIRGHALFRPTEVFDNGTFTWISVPIAGNSPMPALFVREHGQYVIANYTVKGHYLVVQQTFHEAKLRIGNRSVTIVHEGAVNG